MFGRCIRAFLPFLLLATTAPAQNQKLSLVKSFNLSPDIAGKLSISTKNEIWCGADGDLLLPIEHGRFMDQRLVKVSSTGKVLARINVDSVPGFAKSNVVEFGLAPSGNVYVLAARVTFERVDRRKKGEVTSWSQTLEKDTWVLVFNGDGNFHSIARLSMPLYVTAMAPLGPSNLLVVGHKYSTGEINIPFAGVFTRLGELVKEINLPDDLQREEVRGEYYAMGEVRIRTLVDGSVYLQTGRYFPKLSVISPTGEVVSSVRLELPDEIEDLWMQQFSDGEMAAAAIAKNLDNAFVTFDSATGKLARRFELQNPPLEKFSYAGFLACYKQGIFTFVSHDQNRLEIFAPGR